MAFIEVKYGDNAMMGMAGLKKHFEDMESFLSTYPISSICAEARRMFNQKIELGLIHGMKETTKINIDMRKSRSLSAYRKPQACKYNIEARTKKHCKIGFV